MSPVGVHGQKTGAYFERLFQFQAERRGVITTRMPDGCKVLPRKLVRVPTPWDWIVSFPPSAFALLDTKTNEKKFPHSLIVSHQVTEMSRHASVKTGYVIWLRAPGVVLFVPTYVLLRCMRIRGSIDADTVGAISLGGSGDMDVRKIWT